MDILIMSDNNLETVGGEQESTKIIIKSLKDTYSLGVMQPGKLKKCYPNVKYFKLSNQTRIKHLVKRPFEFISYIYNIKKNLQSNKPRIIHTQAQISFFIVSFLKKIRKIPSTTILIHTERGLFSKYNFIFQRIFFFFMKELNTLVTTTEYNHQHWKSALEDKGISINYRVIENTAGELFEEYDENLETDKNNNELYIGFVGRYTGWKNWPLAEEIISKLVVELDGKFVVKMAVGCLDEQSLNETKNMFKRMEKLLGSNFIGMINIPLEKINKFYYDLDFFILTSNKDTESFGRTLVEAMSRKTVVLTTDAGGSVEVVGNNNKVFNTADEFVKRIITTFKDKDKLTKEKEENLQRVLSTYSLKNNIDKHFNLYKKLLQIKRSEEY